ncbi:MAG TPA: helix-turn-helix transcriptional regulator [Rhodospirillaceae bacterium]|nr:helix-turn-helix transcriptional regulator [Rhodospirillaceae bacterium]
MLLKTPTDFGALIRDARRKAKLSQADLARMINATQGWISEIENGKPTAEIGMVLTAITALGLRLESRVLAGTSRPGIADVLSRTKGAPR